jgi:Raf kinase inhibitor-like YbhB/YbcL family protein
MLLAAGALGFASSSCNAGGGEALSPAGTSAATLAVTSQSFASNGEIPVDYTCDGTDKSPQLTWSAAPPGTRSFAIVVEDPDSASGVFTHWIVYNIGADTRSLPEAVDPTAVGGTSGLNDFKRPGYGGPCPPKLELHHYTFRVFALNATLGEGLERDRDAFDAAISGHVLAVGALEGAFSH